MKSKECVCHLIANDSIVINRYDLQFVDHELIDLLKDAFRKIVVFGATISELPVSELQNQMLYIHYNVTYIKESTIRAAVQEEFKKAVRFQKNNLETLYKQMEKDGHLLSDMRKKGNCWVDSFYKEGETEEKTTCKVYGMIGEMFWFILQNLNQSLNEVAVLLEYLMRTNVITSFSLEHLKCSIFNKILSEFAMIKFGSSGTSMASILSTLSPTVKENFVEMHSFGVEQRKKLCENVKGQNLTELVEKIIEDSEKGISEEKEPNGGWIEVKSSSNQHSNLIKDPPSTTQKSLFDRIGDTYLKNFKDDQFIQELKLIDALVSLERQEQKTEKMSKKEFYQQKRKKQKEILKQHEVLLSKERKNHENEEKQIDSQVKEIKITPSNEKIETQAEKQRKIEQCQRQEIQRSKQRAKQDWLTLEAALAKGKFMKKSGKKADAKDLEALKHKMERYKMQEKKWQKNSKNFPQRIQKEEILKLTKDQLKKLKDEKYAQFSYKEDLKIVCEGKSHKIQYRTTCFSSEKKQLFNNELFEYKPTVSQGLDSDRDSENDDTDRVYSVPGKEKLPDNERKESCQEEGLTKKKKNKKNKKKKQKKNQSQKLPEDEDKPMNEAPVQIQKKVEEKSEEEISLTVFLQNCKIDDKDRFDINSSDYFLRKCKQRIEKWKKNNQK